MATKSKLLATGLVDPREHRESAYLETSAVVQVCRTPERRRRCWQARTAGVRQTCTGAEMGLPCHARDALDQAVAEYRF